MFKMYQNPDDGLSLFTNSQAYLDRNKSLTVPPENYRFNSQTHLRFGAEGTSFEENVYRNLQDYKNYIRTPLIGSSGELKQLKKKLYENKIIEENLTNGAKFLSELYGIENLEYLKGVIKQKGSVENVILAEKKGELKDLSKLKKSSSSDKYDRYRSSSDKYDRYRSYQTPYQTPYRAPYQAPYQVPYQVPPRSVNELHSKILSLLDKKTSERPVQNSELFLKQIIKDTYEPDTKMYKNKDDISVMLSKYAKLMKEYKLKTKEIKNGLVKLTDSLSATVGVPKRELKPFVNMAIPMIEKEPKFFR